ncbi:MAG: MBL fold metallo-hydrolase [Woeseiaceae bacterium]|nr:MBL fold metallo-hydrolase [Woeseiaceae bacterium]
MKVDGEQLFAGSGHWREITADDAAQYWHPAQESGKIDVPGDNWPAKVNMTLAELAADVYLVRGVRTGFQHMVVNTPEGLVVADAPAGWVEFHHVPPADLVPGLGVSGLSELLVEFLAKNFPERPILATAITHMHDDHAGGARAFAAAGAAIYTTRESGVFLANALNRSSMPNDRLARLREPAAVSPIETFINIGGPGNQVRLINMGKTPHVDSMLGIWAVDRGYFFVSDIHVPGDDSSAPRDDRAQSECWFARWAVDNLPAETLVVNSHSSPVTPVARLAQYLDHPLCQH